MKIENKSGCEQQEKLCTAYLWGCKKCRYITTDCYKLKDKGKKGKDVEKYIAERLNTN